MIPQNSRPGATPMNVNGETVAFKIKNSGKGFRILIDGLYSNKVLAVIRELCSNAADSHAAAKQSKPFKVQIPTSMDPTFRVRDYGTSLTHDQVMHLYTTIFESTKEDTNEQTGQLGLGSKSPFAYTDTFQVVTWLDGVERTYIAHLATDGVPSITYMGDRPSTEPQGLEVSFPAKREDIQKFQREMKFVSLAYRDNMPEIDGMTVNLPTPRLAGNGWAIYPRNGVFQDIETRHFLRQGSAVYPNKFSFPHLGYGWVSIIDVPIGTADVTASRDSLAYTNHTETAVHDIVQASYKELMAQVEADIAKATTRVAKAGVYALYTGVLDNLRGRTTVSLVIDPDNRKRDPLTNSIIIEPGESLEHASKFGKTQSGRYSSHSRFISEVEHSSIKQFKLIVDDPSTKLVRRFKRINSIGDRSMAYVLSVADAKARAKAVAWVKQCLELTDAQIILSSDIPDIPPARRPGTVKGQRRMPKPGQYWMKRSEGRVHSLIFGMSDLGPEELPTRMQKAWTFVGLKETWDDIFWVNERQYESHMKRGELDEKLRLDTVLKKMVEAKLAKMPVDEAVTYSKIVSQTGRSNRALQVVFSEFYPTLTVTEQIAQQVMAAAGLIGIDLHSLPIAAKVEAEIQKLSDEYPLLFQRSDPSHYKHYVKAVKAAKV